MHVILINFFFCSNTDDIKQSNKSLGNESTVVEINFCKRLQTSCRGDFPKSSSKHWVISIFNERIANQFLYFQLFDRHNSKSVSLAGLLISKFLFPCLHIK